MCLHDLAGMLSITLLRRNPRETDRPFPEPALFVVNPQVTAMRIPPRCGLLQMA